MAIVGAQAQPATDRQDGGSLPETGVGLPLPLGPDEVYVPFAKGCGIVLPANSAPATVTFYRGYAWLGACHFGVAHGSGLAIPPDGNGKFEFGFHYGHFVSSRYDSPVPETRKYLQTATSAGNEQPNDGLMFDSEPIGEGRISRDSSVRLEYTERNVHYTHTLRFGDLDAPCYFGRILTPKEWKLIGDLQPLQGMCRAANVAGTSGERAGKVFGFWHDVETAPASAMKSRELLVKSTRSVQQDYHLCLRLPGDCEQKFRDELAPLMPRIQAIKAAGEAIEAARVADSNRQIAEMKAKVDARFAPLEARRAELMRQYAKAGQ